MTSIEITGDVRSTLTHFAALGLAAILEAELQGHVKLSARTMRSVRVDFTGESTTSALGLADAVRAHARRHLSSWVTQTHEHVGSIAGTMSPRLKSATGNSDWTALQEARFAALDSAGADDAGWLDLMLMGALGEPAYWYVDNQGNTQPDRGASGWEMKTRNRGEEFVQHRLAPLCKAVSQRDVDSVLDGLTGAAVVDEVGGGPDSRTPTGLANPQETDNALAWCALWGISLFPVSHSSAPELGTYKGSGKQSVTAGILRGLPRPEPSARASTYLPLFQRPLRLSRVRTLISSGALARAAASAVLERTRGTWPDRERARLSRLAQQLDSPGDRDWLLRKGCDGLLLSHITASDNPNAPELHVVRGDIVRLRGVGP